MKQQINSICYSSYCQLKLIHHIRKYLNETATKALTSAFTRHITVRLLQQPLHESPNRTIKQTTENTKCSSSTRRDHITPALMTLHWLPIAYRSQFKILMIVFKSRLGLVPQYLADLFQWYQPNRTLRSTDDILLVYYKCIIFR